MCQTLHRKHLTLSILENVEKDTPKASEHIKQRPRKQTYHKLQKARGITITCKLLTLVFLVADRSKRCWTRENVERCRPGISPPGMGPTELEAASWKGHILELFTPHIESITKSINFASKASVGSVHFSPPPPPLSPLPW